MRKDMQRVIIDGAPRREGFDNERIRKDDDLPEQEGIRRGHKGWGPSPGDRLSPLRRFLYKNVGRHWDKVYSEICEHADTRSLIGNHLRDHVWTEVNTYEEHLINEGRYPWYYRRFYIDKGGFLRTKKDNPRWRNRGREKDADACCIGDQRYERVNGCWFEVSYKPITMMLQHWNYALQKNVNEYYNGETKDVQRQLGKKELKALGLSNDRDFKWWEAA